MSSFTLSQAQGYTPAGDAPQAAASLGETVLLEHWLLSPHRRLAPRLLEPPEALLSIEPAICLHTALCSVETLEILRCHEARNCAFLH